MKNFSSMFREVNPLFRMAQLLEMLMSGVDKAVFVFNGTIIYLEPPSNIFLWWIWGI